jgi:hypothetical protein
VFSHGLGPEVQFDRGSVETRSAPGFREKTEGNITRSQTQQSRP